MRSRFLQYFTYLTCFPNRLPAVDAVSFGSAARAMFVWSVIMFLINVFVVFWLGCRESSFCFDYFWVSTGSSGNSAANHSSWTRRRIHSPGDPRPYLVTLCLRYLNCSALSILFLLSCFVGQCFHFISSWIRSLNFFVAPNIYPPPIDNSAFVRFNPWCIW